MTPRRSILGLPICCWPAALLWLLRGIAWGWWTVRGRGYPGTRWLIWKSWFWPGFIHQWRFNEPCRHDAIPRRQAATARERP